MCRWLVRFLRKIGFMQQRSLPVGDVRVIGLVAGSHTIEDIGRDVPHGETVTIPADQAFRSKDLWRGISQKCLMQMPLIAATPSYVPPQQALPAPERQRLEGHIRNLEAQLRSMAAENLGLKEELRRASEAQAQKLDTILAALQNGIPVAVGLGASRVAAPKQEVADGSAPTFLPSEIKPKDVSVHIEIQGEAAPSELSNAAERLRQMRNKGDGR